ncbi:MAG: lysophospholipid acyltransferase family protein [Bradymonadaceae bacterium]
MLDLQRMHHIELSGNPNGQKFLATVMLRPNYQSFPGVDIALEGTDNLPDEPVIYAMNHTDRYNYWPFQYRLWQDLGRFTATWVKGKYYQNPFMGKFMEWMNNIPVVSRGYLIGRDFKNVTGERPSDEQYRALRRLVNRSAVAAIERAEAGERPAEAELAAIPEAIFEQPRSLLGLDYKPDRHRWADRLMEVFEAMMERFVDLNGEALRKGLDLLVFPQGTRSIRLSRGRIGLAQIALFYDETVVPVGCNGSDRVYPGDSPLAQSGDIVYRIGEPIGAEERTEFAIEESFEPFTPAAEHRYRDRFQGYVDLVMERINGLLDPRYQFDDEKTSDGVDGARRFV